MPHYEIRRLDMFKKAITTAVAGTLAIGVFAGFSSEEYRKAAAGSKPKEPAVKNIIFLIGDGMGFPYLTAHRYMKDDPATKEIERTAFDKYMTGMQSTYPDDHSQNITDSASAATAMSAGVKTYNNAIAVDVSKHEVKTVLEQAKEIGKSTGLVATSEITHATPASFGAHDESRKNMNQIADDYFDDLVKGEHKIDVLLGGGLSNFLRKDRDLTKEFQKAGFSYVQTKQQLLSDQNEQVLGLFADGGLPKMLDRNKETPSLKDMTKTAIQRLNKDKDGFFLMIEGSQIDWAGHDNDAVAAMSEMEDFEQAYAAALDFARKDKETLVVVTADHSTGGFSLGTGGEYNWFPAPLQSAKRTPDYMAGQIAKGENIDKVLHTFSGLTLTADELAAVKKAAIPVKGKIDAASVDDAIERIYDKRSGTGWTTGGHTGEEVPVLAYGPGSEKFTGFIDNTDQAMNMFSFLKDTKAPERPSVNPVSTKDTRINGTSEDGAAIAVKNGNKTLAAARTDKNGRFSAAIPKQQAGTKLTVTAEDRAGNVSKAARVTVSR